MPRPQTFDSEKALDAAIAVFWKHGYERTSLNDLLAEMGIQRSSLYNSFGDKHALFVQALDKYITFANDAFIVAGLRAGETGLSGIRQVLETLAGLLADDRDCKGCMMVNAQLEIAISDTEVHQRIDASVGRIIAAFAEALQRALVAEEILPQITPQAGAHLLTNTVIGMRALGRATNERRIFDDVVQTTLLLLEPRPNHPI